MTSLVGDIQGHAKCSLFRLRNPTKAILIQKITEVEKKRVKYLTRSSYSFLLPQPFSHVYKSWIVWAVPLPSNSHHQEDYFFFTWGSHTICHWEGDNPMTTLQEINISHLGKRKIISKYAISGGYVNSLEGSTSTIAKKNNKTTLHCQRSISFSLRPGVEAPGREIVSSLEGLSDFFLYKKIDDFQQNVIPSGKLT